MQIANSNKLGMYYVIKILVGSIQSYGVNFHDIAEPYQMLLQSMYNHELYIMLLKS